MFTAREIELVKCSLFECIWKVFNNYNDNTSDDDDRHIPSVARMSDTVLSTLRVSSHLIAILGDESSDSFGCKSQKPDSNRLEDKALFFFLARVTGYLEAGWGAGRVSSAVWLLSHFSVYFLAPPSLCISVMLLRDCNPFPQHSQGRRRWRSTAFC